MYQGTAFQYGDNVDTDVIIPARYLNAPSAEELAKHCMEDIDVNFVKEVKKGDIMIGGENFGCGSSREHAPIAIRASGISCVIAASFARIVYRNTIYIGFPILECPEAAARIKKGDTVTVDADQGIIKNETTGEVFHATPFPAFINRIIENGGLLPYLVNKEAGK
jgi:3-isopropylmalate/(R)-2-methylmalate dehydratase small subunit